MFYVYILQSAKDHSFYKGQTNDLRTRIKRHNSGYENYTSRLRPWQLVWFVVKPSRLAAKTLESKLKRLSKQRLFEFMKKYPVKESHTGLDVYDPIDQ